MIFHIVTPSYNGAAFINSTIHSVVSQAGDFSINYHVQDGGSTDGTVELLRAWELLLAQPSPLVACRAVRFSWSSEPDAGMYEAINKGFARFFLAPQDLMAWVNTDDIYLPQAFASAAHIAADLPGLLWFGGGILHVQDEVLRRSDMSLQGFPPEMVQKGCCAFQGGWRYLEQAAMFWRGSLWHKAGPLNAALRYAGDFELWPRFAAHTDFVHLPVPLACYRIRKEQLSQQEGCQKEKEQIMPFAKRWKISRAFWNSHLLPPLAPSLQQDEHGTFSPCQKRAWPHWGTGWACYRARLGYYASVLRAQCVRLFRLRQKPSLANGPDKESS